MPHTYAIQCDKYRNNEAGEHAWRAMMCHAQLINAETFCNYCDPSGLLDDGETLEDYMEANEDIRFFQTPSDQGPVFFIQTHGFEFFFTEDGTPPVCTLEYDPLVNELVYATDARLLMPANNPLAVHNGHEVSEMIEPDLEMIRGDAIRFRLFREGKPVAGIVTKEGVVDNLYSRFSFRRQGYASEIFRCARSVLGDLKHSTHLTEDGSAFVKGMKEHDDSPSP